MHPTIAIILSSNTPYDAVEISGWVRTRRDGKEFSFLEINDGSTVENLQIIADTSLDNYETVRLLSTGSSITVKGELRTSQGKGQRWECLAESITIYGIAPSDYPLQKKRHSFEYLREIAHLRPKTNTIAAVMRLRSALSFAVHQFFRERNFYYIHTPIITTSDCEGAGEMFQVTTLDINSPPRTTDGSINYSNDFFSKKAYLTVSGQLEGEIYSLGLKNVYTFGPTFRAENSNTPRHLAEFWMIEPEMAFCHLSEDMDLAEEFVRYCITSILTNNHNDLSFFNDRIDNTVFSRLETISQSSFERVPYSDAISLLEKNNDLFSYKVHWGSDLQTEHERYLTENVFKKPVIIYDYPSNIKAFYMRSNDDGKTVAAMDVLVAGIGEIIGGSEREERYDILLQRIKALGLNEKSYSWYLDLRKFGTAPHSGFGLGFERLLLLSTGMQNIRDVIPFPRYPGNANF